MIYPFVCDVCGARRDLILPMDKRNDPVHCAGGGPTGVGPGHVGVGPLMRREVARPTVHYKGAGWTRTPSIMNDPIAAGHPGQRSNWGVETQADYGDPNLISPYKHIIGNADQLDSADVVGEGV